jgi:uncharacterized protein YndB with AHSA1/START domain
VGCWREQTLIDAPLEDVWELVGDPRRYPEWAEGFVEVTGLPEVRQGAQYEGVTRGPVKSMKGRTTFEIDALDDLHEIRMRCTQSGWYSRWVLTEAEGATFADVEVGMEPISSAYSAMDKVTGKRWYRRVAQGSLDGIKRALSREPASTAD